MSFTLGGLAGYCGGRLSGDASLSITEISTDTRSIAPGSLFVAIVGENFDGHEFANDAIANGAAAVLISREVPGLSAPSIRVDDSIAALGELARGQRERFEIPVVGITGSNGKTTTRELCCAILGAAGVRTHATLGNLNNHIGLPLTVLQLDERAQVMVVEMGMNHPGEIEHLARIASPTVGAITNVAPAHLGPLGSIEAIAQAKGELFECIRPEGTAIINIDNPLIIEQASRFKGEHISFGCSADADFRGLPETPHEGRAVFELVTALGRCRIQLGAPGLHLIENSLCAAAAAFATGLLTDDPLGAIQNGLESFSAVSGRLNVKPAAGGLVLIDDSYNSNPHSVRAALATLTQMRAGAHTFAVLGDMLELGPREAEIHEEIGRVVAEQPVDALVAVGELSQNTWQAARDAGLSQVHHVMLAEDAVSCVRELANSGDIVLIKGSRGMHMERAVNALVEGT